MNTLRTIRQNPRVAIVDDERDIGNRIIVTLKKGFSFDPMCDNRVSGGSTIEEVLERVRYSLKFDGPYDP